MARAVDYDDEIGGVMTINDFRQRKPDYSVQPQKSPLEIVERVLSIPELKPIYEQGARLIGAYADKLSLDNQARFNNMSGQKQNNNPGGSCIYGVGSNQP